MKTIKKFNFRVEVVPRGDYWVDETEQRWRSKCQTIKNQIERHVDGAESVDIVYDTEAICSLCGFTWEVSEITDEDWIAGEPVCCLDASDEWRKENLQ